MTSSAPDAAHELGPRRAADIGDVRAHRLCQLCREGADPCRPVAPTTATTAPGMGPTEAHMAQYDAEPDALRAQAHRQINARPLRLA